MRIKLILVAVLALACAAVVTPPALGQDALSVSIDMKTTNNNDSNVGAIDNCAEIPKVGDTLTFDLVVQGVKSADKIAGYQVDIDYDKSVIMITGVIGVDGTPNDELMGGQAAGTTSIISRINSSGGTHFLNLSEAVPDSDGSFTVAALDGTVDPPPPNNHEDGEGVLARITVKAVGKGNSDLIIAGPRGGADGNPDLIIMGGTGQFQGAAIPVDKTSNAAVSVGQSCKPPSSPGTSGGTETVAPQSTPPGGTPTEDGTPEAGTTPQPDNTPTTANTPTNGTPEGTAGAETPGPGTAVQGSTSVPGNGNQTNAGGEASATEESGNGNGLSTGAWAGIGVGIAAAVLAASGVGWIALRRRRAGGTPTPGGGAGSE